MAKNDPTPTDVPDAAPDAPASPWDGSGGIDSLAAEMLRNNRNDFLKAARSQRFAFATVKWLFLVIFLIALGAMIAAVRIAIDVPESGYDWARAGVVATVAVMAIILFALLLYMRPLAALERNSVVQSFLTVVVNSYWTRLSFVKEAAGLDAHLEGATAYTVEHLAALLDRQLLGSSKYLDVVRRAQDEAGEDTTAYRSPG